MTPDPSFRKTRQFSHTSDAPGIRRGDADPAAAAALAIAVDSSSFFDGAHKLGLGSSAAVTVAATALALAATSQTLDRAEVLAIASAAHADAQGAMGARGSGADIASAVYGGAIEYRIGPAITNNETTPGDQPPAPSQTPTQDHDDHHNE